MSVSGGCLLLLVLLNGLWFRHPLLLLLPAPELVWTQMQFLWTSGRLWSAALITVETIAKAYAIAVSAGIVVGFLVTRSRNLMRTVW